ncbi:hypothetical protein Tco_0519199 [Tanacetum coccineum]
MEHRGEAGNALVLLGMGIYKRDFSLNEQRWSLICVSDTNGFFVQASFYHRPGFTRELSGRILLPTAFNSIISNQTQWNHFGGVTTYNLNLIASQSDLASATFSCLAILGPGGADVSPVDILSYSHALNIIFSLPDDRDFHCCDSGWRNVLFCHLTIKFFLFRVSTQALIPLAGSFTE